MSMCDQCGGIGCHKTWCTRPANEAKAVTMEGDIAAPSEEEKQRQLQRKADQAELIDWILHYKNPADDETKLRQIRLVME